MKRTERKGREWNGREEKGVEDVSILIPWKGNLIKSLSAIGTALMQWVLEVKRRKVGGFSLGDPDSSILWFTAFISEDDSIEIIIHSFE